MKQIEILHADHFGYNGPSGFERVRFPALVRAEPYRYDDSDLTLDTLMLVPIAELKRIGYDGPTTSSGSLTSPLNPAYHVNDRNDWDNSSHRHHSSHSSPSYDSDSSTPSGGACD